MAKSKLFDLDEPRLDTSTNALSYLYDNLDSSLVSPMTAPVGAVGALPVIDDILDTNCALHVTLSFADASVINNTDTIDDIWSAYGASGWLFMHDVFLPVYDIGDSTYYVAIAFQQVVLGSDLQVSDTCFVYDNADAQVVDGCIFDKNTGLAYIPKALFNDSDFDRIQMQALIVIDISEGLPEITVPVRFAHDSELYIEVTAPITEQVLSIDLTQVGISNITADDISVVFDGSNIELNTSNSAMRLSDDGNTLYLFMPLVCVCGLTINVKQPGFLGAFLPTKAFGLTAGPETMVTWPYGTLKHDGTLSVGTEFHYDSWGYYPNRCEPGWQNAIMGAYEFLHSSAYWWAAYINDGTVDNYNAGDATLMSWDDIASRVVNGPHAIQMKDVPDIVIVPGDEWVWTDDMKYMADVATEHLYGIYWGQMMVLPGAPGTTNYDLKNQEWWFSLVSGWPDNFPNSIGWTTAYCMHANQATTTTFPLFASRVRGKVLYEGTETYDGSKQRYFYVIALTTEEIAQWSGAEGANAIQGCTVIYKVASDSVTGYVTMNKTFEEQ